MKKIFLFIFSYLLWSGTGSLMAQDVIPGPSGIVLPVNSDIGNFPAATPVAEAVVAGNGTHRGQNISAANGNAFTGVVNTLVGDAQITATDFNYNRNGFPLKFERYFHNGITSPFGEMGQNWTSNYDICLFVPVVNVDHILLTMPHQSWKFTSPDGGQTFTRPAGCFYQLQSISTSSVISNPPADFSGTTYVLTNSTGTILKFNILTDGEPNIARLVEMDDLNGNKTVLSYQSYSVYNATIYGTYSYVTYGSNPVSQSYNYLYANISAIRLQTITGNNWSINFTYYDDTGAPTTDWITNTCGTNCPNGSCYSYCDQLYVVTTQNFTGNRLKRVTNSVGDVITFDSGYQAGPVTQVNRAHNGDSYALNASYQYYSYQYYPPNSGPISVSTLKKVVDPLAPPGSRNLTYICESNPNNFSNPVRQTVNGMGQVVYAYDYSADPSGNQLTNISGPNGHIETDVYDPTGRIVKKIFTVDGHPFNETYTWNQDNLMTSDVDGNGDQTTMTYDSLGNVTYRRDAEGYYESNTYSAIGTNSVGTNVIRLTQSTDKNLVNRTYDYYTDNRMGLPFHTYEPGRTTAYGYSITNGTLNWKTITDANTHTTTFNYDANGNVVSAMEPAIGPPENLPSATTYFVYDNGITGNGQGRDLLTTQIDPLSQTITYTYQNNAWLQTISYPDNTNEQFTYDVNNGNILSSQDRNLVLTKFNYDGTDHLTDSYEAFGTPDVRHGRYTFDSLGHMTSLTDNKGQKTNFILNEQSRVRTTSDPIGKGETRDYDGAMNLIRSRDTRGITRTITYYKNNRVKSVQYSDGTPSISYTYDGNGNPVGMMDGVGSKIYTYDPLNELTNVSDQVRNFTLTYTYDPAGNKLSMQNNKIPGTTYYGYYENNQTKAVTDVDGIVTTYIYDPMKNPQNTVYSNGVTASYGYYPTTHRLQSLSNFTTHGETLSSFAYAYDNVGNQLRMTDLSGTTNYVYDNLYQLKAASYPGPQGTVGYGYDGVGNRTELTQNGIHQTLSYDPGNELTNGLGDIFSYDQSGNTAQRTSSAGTTIYNWDAKNQLVKVTAPGGIITYVYDGDGYRVKKTTSNGTTNYFYDSGSVVVETDANGNILKSYTPGISVKDQQGSKLFYLYNGHGDVTGLTDAKQSLVQSYVYDAFGKTLGDQKDANNYRYVGTGGVFSDDDIDLQYMWHRWYDPKLGRFISRDPKGLGGGLDLYVYCSNNPVKGIDPSGLQEVEDPFEEEEPQNNGVEAGKAILKIGATEILVHALELGEYLNPVLLPYHSYELAKPLINLISDFLDSRVSSYLPYQTRLELDVFYHIFKTRPDIDIGSYWGLVNVNGQPMFELNGSIITFGDERSFIIARDAAMSAQAQAAAEAQAAANAQGEASYEASQGHCTSGCGGPTGGSGPTAGGGNGSCGECH